MEVNERQRESQKIEGVDRWICYHSTIKVFPKGSNKKSNVAPNRMTCSSACNIDWHVKKESQSIAIRVNRRVLRRILNTTATNPSLKYTQLSHLAQTVPSVK